VLISAFTFGGIPRQAVDQAFAQADIYASPSLLKEYREAPLALASGGKIDSIQLKALISGIAAFAIRLNAVYPKQKIAVCRDPEDNMVVECCIEARANILITGDKDLLELASLIPTLKILTPRQYLYLQ
jgi:putative PIN family toxin of toxin-antitoxin system